MKPYLVIVGSGIKFLSHLTIEAKTYIEKSEKILYLANDPAIKLWINKINPNSETLENIYFKYNLRIDSYKAITRHILENLRRDQNVCVVMYGHPCVVAQPGIDAVIQARKEGYNAKILPGISSEDCLFADLLIDPGSIGCNSFETTDFIINKRKFDTNSHLILWQVDIIGQTENPISPKNEKGLKLLYNRLKKYYPTDHKILSYEAAQYPFFNPTIKEFTLDSLIQTYLTSISTLYIPPISISLPSELLLKKLGH